MTALLEPTRRAETTWTIGAPRLLAGLDRAHTLDLRTHLAVHGELPAVGFDRLLGLLDQAGLTGRGGAGFPLSTKLRSLRGRRSIVVVNGSESEPASHKDRTMLRRSPHLVLDGALTVARSIGAARTIVAVHDMAAATALDRAVRERRDARHVQVVLTDSGFVGGEARALLSGLAGGPAIPPGHRWLPTHEGFVVSNVETFAQVAVLVRMGARDFAMTGTDAEPGTVLMTLGGALERPGVVEIPIGTPLGILMRAAGGDDARYLVAGGYHGMWTTVQPDVPVSRAGLAAAGATLGAGVMYALDDSTCALGELARVTRWLAAQSARQCGPCRFGLPALADDVAAAEAGHPHAVEIADHHAGLVTGRGACAHPDGAARFARSGLAVLRDEVVAHRHGGCGRPVRGLLPVGGAY